MVITSCLRLGNAVYEVAQFCVEQSDLLAKKRALGNWKVCRRHERISGGEVGSVRARGL